jgi:hypothetical protein
MAALAQCLIDTLNPDANTRVAAELRLSELFLDPGGSSPVGSPTRLDSVRQPPQPV